MLFGGVVDLYRKVSVSVSVSVPLMVHRILMVTLFCFDGASVAFKMTACASQVYGVQKLYD